jgi:hypothetical protein
MENVQNMCKFNQTITRLHTYLSEKLYQRNGQILDPKIIRDQSDADLRNLARSHEAALKTVLCIYTYITRAKRASISQSSTYLIILFWHTFQNLL